MIGDSKFLSCSKSLTRELRHSKETWSFSERGSMNIADLFDEMRYNSPKEHNMSDAEFAAFLLCKPTQRFFIDIHMQWEWKPYGVPPSYPFDVRLSCTQGHSD